MPHQKPGDPEKGKEAFETRGCMACHSMGEGDQKQGGTFAANLSREGEKDNYDYLVRWVHNPRQRTLPYCSVRKERSHRRRLHASTACRSFSIWNTTSAPTTATSCRCMQMTPMPSLRLTEDEARDIASYLMTRKHDDVTYANADYMDDPSLKNKRPAPGAFLRLRRAAMKSPGSKKNSASAPS